MLASFTSAHSTQERETADASTTGTTDSGAKSGARANSSIPGKDVVEAGDHESPGIWVCPPFCRFVANALSAPLQVEKAKKLDIL